MQEVRETIQQRRILEEKRMNFNSVQMPVAEKERFVIQRKLGLKHQIPGSGRW
jgi:hypothetical protein